MRALSFCLTWLSILWASTSPAADSLNPEHIRLGISYASFGRVSPNDASAALKVWATTATKERHFNVTVQVDIFEDGRKLCSALDRAEVDAVSMTAEEFLLSGQQPDSIFVTAKHGGFTERYVIAVRRQRKLTGLAALQHSRLVRHANALTCVAMPWLETLLASEKLEPANLFFSELLPLESPSKSVLRVFFGQSDACLVTTNSFAVACELNPQLHRDLEILAVSPPVIPAFFFFRPGCRADTRALLEPALLDLHTKPAGEQVLTVFQCVRMEKQPLSAFDPTRRLLLEYRRLQDAPSLKGSSASPSPPQALLSR